MSIQSIASLNKFRAKHNCEHRREIAEHVRKYGGSASITLLDPSCKIFSIPDIHGVVGYRVESGCAVVFGDPLCEPQDTPHLARAFHHYCENNNWRVVYVTASQTFSKWAINNTCSSLIEAGEELVLDPHHNPRSGIKGRGLRNKVNNSLRAGIIIKEYLGGNEQLERQLEEVGESWLQARHGLQIYLTDVQLFTERLGKRWFYAEHCGRVVGVLLLNELQARKGWVLHLLMLIPEAPLGTSEQLVVSTLEKLEKEKCHFLTFGIVQAEKLGEIIGLNPLSSWIARMAFVCLKRLFGLDKRRRYWRKFKPTQEHSYLLFSKPRIGLREISSIMRALNVK